jgi:RNA ligase (TIGR02306 family)
MRKLATIRKIDTLTPIEGADAIECATVGGWKVVAQKGLYKEGDLAVYFEIDSWIPTTIAPFLSKGKEPREFEGVKGERLKTIKLRGQISQGLLMPLKEIGEVLGLQIYGELYGDFEDGYDMTDLLGIKKWEKPINAQLAGVCKGNFPTLIPKTDQERVQNLKKEIEVCHHIMFEVTEKLEGSSMTVYQIKGEFGVCSRNMDLKETEGNSFWATARKDNIQEKMMEVDPYWDFAIQGELVGPGIQGNIYGLKEPEFRVFDVYNIQAGEYLTPTAREDLIKRMDLKHVPVLDDAFILNDTVDSLLKLAEGKSRLADTEREGIVFKAVDGGITFKAISNKYLLGEK